LYFVALFAEFMAPADPEAVAERYKYLSPQGIAFHGLRPGAHGLTSTRNPETLRVTYTADRTKWYPIGLFVRGDEYKMWGLFKTDRHLFGLGPGSREADAPLYLLGSDRLGRDMLSRMVYGTRVSLLIGLISVALSLIFGIALGGVSGFYGGT